MGSASRHSETDYAQVISEKIFVSGASSQNVGPLCSANTCLWHSGTLIFRAVQAKHLESESFKGFWCTDL